MGNRGRCTALAAVALAGSATAVAAVRRGRRAPGPERVNGHLVVVHAVTVDRPAPAVPELWQDAARLSAALDRPVEIERIEHGRWRCLVGEVGGPRTMVDITADDVDRTVRWRVTDGRAAHAGRLTLVPAPQGRGTELRMELRWPQSRAGRAAALLASRAPDQVARTLLRRAKSLIECGQVISTVDDPSGRGPVAERLTRTMREKLTVGGRP